MTIPDTAQPEDPSKPTGNAETSISRNHRSQAGYTGIRSKSKQGDIRHAIVDILEYTYGSWIVIVVFSVFLTLDPSTEVIVGFLTDFQTTTENRGRLSWPVLIAIWSLGLLPIMAHLTAAWVLRQCGRRERIGKALILLIPLICLASYTSGFLKATNSAEAQLLGLNTSTAILLLIGIIFIFATYLAIYFLSWIGRFVYSKQVDHLDHILSTQSNNYPGLTTLIRSILKPGVSKSGDLIRFLFPLMVFLAPLFGLILYFGLIDPSGARIIGPIGIVAVFGIAACIVFAVLTVLSYAFMPGGFPLILLPIAVAFAVTDRAVTNGLIAVMLVAIGVALFYGGTRKWFGVTVFSAVIGLGILYDYTFPRVPDCQTLAGCNMMRGAASDHSGYATIKDTIPDLPGAVEGTPLRIVAAQGGGLYAAYHTAYYLAARADTEPGFAESLYAISGVSGGSVGAGAYWVVRASDVCPTPGNGTRCHRDAVDQILRRDYLTPSVATLFFRDFLDTLFPVSAILELNGHGPIDRGHILENELLDATGYLNAPSTTDQRLGLSMTIGESAFVGRNDPNEPMAHPLLFFNSTQVDNGARAIVSPVARLRDTRSNIVTNEGNDLLVVNGMVNSARFPIITPPARVAINGPEGPKTIQLVDGAYFDNSGIETALDIIIDLHAAGVKRPMEIVIFTAEEVGADTGIKGTLGAPLTAFTGAWRARRDHSAVRVDDVVSDRRIPIELAKCSARANAQEVNFTVSWYLSTATFDNLRDQIDHAIAGGNAC